MKNVIIALPLLLLFLNTCVSFGPSSRAYKPLAWEHEHFNNSIKNIMPSDLLKAGDEYIGEKFHWVGIIDTFFIDENVSDSIITVKILFEQKYYDYIEDFSIQDETIFLSSKGEGKFAVLKEFIDIPVDTIKSSLAFLVKDKSLGFCYGNYKSSENGLPILEDGAIRFIPHHFYSTNIFYYEIERDSTGKVVTRKDGLPSLTNFKMLKVAGSGQNK